MSAVDSSAPSLDDRLNAAAEVVQQDPAGAAADLSVIVGEAADRGDLAVAGHASYLCARAHVNLGELDVALVEIDAAEAWFFEAGRSVDAARTTLGRMHVLDDLGRQQEAIVAGWALLDAVAAHGDGVEPDLARLAAAALENIGVSSGALGRHNEALSAYAEAIVRYRSVGCDADAARCGANRGVELLEIGRHAEAVETLEVATAAFVRDGDALFAGQCAAYAATAHARQGDFVSARELLDRSEALLGDTAVTIDWARAQLQRGETLMALNLADEAAALYERLRTRFATSGLRRDHALATLGLAGTVLQAGRAADASELFGEAQAAFFEIGDDAMWAISVLGRSWHGADDARLDAARRAAAVLRTCDRSHDEIRARVRIAEIDSAERHAEVDRCEALLTDRPAPHLRWQVLRLRALAQWDGGDRSAAIATMRCAAAVVEELRETVLDEHSLIPFLGSRRSVHEDLVRMLLDDGAKDAAWDEVLGSRARTLLERTVVAQKTDPADGHDGPNDDGVLTVVYEVLGSEIVAFVREGSRHRILRRVGEVSKVRSLLRRLAAQWRRFPPGFADADAENLALASTLDVLEGLHSVLIGPIREVSSAEALHVVPVGVLSDVPFGALFDGERHVIEQMPVVVAASPRFTGTNGRRMRSVVVLGVGDDTTPEISTEIEVVAATVDDVAVFDVADATSDALIEAAPQHDIVHVACHGHNRSDNPALSSLALADREITAHELSDIHLDGQLVVLSSCSSGRQRDIGNVDELLGLPRAFVVAGAAHVIVNLWQVDDSSASSLMGSFHRHLATFERADTASVSSALRAAQVEIMVSHPHPYHWAPSVVYAGVPSQPEETS